MQYVFDFPIDFHISMVLVRRANKQKRAINQSKWPWFFRKHMHQAMGVINYKFDQCALESESDELYKKLLCNTMKGEWEQIFWSALFHLSNLLHNTSHIKVVVFILKLINLSTPRQSDRALLTCFQYNFNFKARTGTARTRACRTTLWLSRPLTSACTTGELFSSFWKIKILLYMCNTALVSIFWVMEF